MDTAFLAELAGFFGDPELLMLPEALNIEVPAADESSTDGSLSPLSSTFCEEKSAKSQDAQQRSLYREREKKRRHDLRHKVAELSERLEMLRSQGHNAKTNEQGSSISLAVWKALAIQQKGARLMAESEQRRLCAAIDSRAALIHDFRGFVRKRVMEASLTDDVVTSVSLTPSTKRARLDPTDIILYETFAQQLDAVHAQTDKVMRDCSMASIGVGALSYRPTRKTQDKAEFFEYAWKQFIPFDLQRTRRVFWKVAHMQHRQDDRQVHSNIGQNGNTIAFKFTIKGDPTSTVSLSEHIVVRRYNEENRTVVVWRSLVEGNGALNGMHSDKTGWCIVRPFQTGTIKETYVRQVPIYFQRAKTKQNVSQFTILIHRSSEEDGIAIARGLVA